MSKPTHTEFQEQIIQLAHTLGWRHLHVRRSIGKGRRWVTTTNVIGWPDLLLWHPLARSTPRAIEVKVPPDDVTPAQSAVLDELAAAGIPTMVAWPDHFDDVIAFLDVKR